MKKGWMTLLTGLIITLCVGVTAPAEAADIQVEVDGQRVLFDQPPIIYNDRVMVPMRALAETLGAEVFWDNENRYMVSQRGEDVLLLRIDDPVMFYNGQGVLLDAPPMIVNGRTLAPIRAVSEGYDAKVDWDSAMRKVIVTLNAGNNNDGTGGESGGEVVIVSPEAYAYEVFELVNQERTNAGLEPFVWNEEVAALAAAHCQDMAQKGYFDYYNLDGLSLFEQMDQAGIYYAGAAIQLAGKTSTPEEVVKEWMRSSSERERILNPRFNEMGVGYYYGGAYGHYWTQCLICA